MCVCGVRYDAHARGARGGCQDPFEGEQGNCLHGMGPEAPPAFKPGDKVRRKGSDRVYTAVSWPETGLRMQDEHGKQTMVSVHLLEPIPPADPRVDVARDSLFAVVADQDKRDLYARTVLAALDNMEEK